MHDDDPPPAHGWCVQIFLVADHAMAMRLESALQADLGGPVTAACVDGARWPVLVVETPDDSMHVEQVAATVTDLDPTSILTHRSASQPWSMRPAPTAAPADGLSQPA